MRRIATGTALIIVMGLAGGLAWSLALLDDRRATVAKLNDELDRANERVTVSLAARRKSVEAGTAIARRARAARQHARVLEGRLSGARLDLRRVAAIARALVSPPRRVFEARLLAGGTDDLLVVSWHENHEGVTVTGFDVWRLTVDSGGRPTSWDLVFVAEPRPSFDVREPNRVLFGPPGAPAREEAEPVQRIDVADAGDATGDGAEDLAIWEAGSGSGGCGHVRLLQNAGGTLRETYRHEGCNHDLAIVRGHLVLEEAWRPKGCDQIHGCGRRDTSMRWTGSSWAVTDVRRRAY